GIKVALITQGEIGQGATGFTTAHLTAVPDISFAGLVSKFGEKTSETVIASYMEAINNIEELANILKIDCDFKRVPGYKFTESIQQVSQLEEEAKIASQLGL